MAQLALHPRVANMVERGHAMGLGRLACIIGSLLGERDVLAAHAPSADVALRLDALRDPDSGATGFPASHCRCSAMGDDFDAIPFRPALPVHAQCEQCGSPATLQSTASKHTGVTR